MTHPLNGNVWVRACGAAVAAAGALVLAGWLTGTLALIQIHPEWVPMQGNTALGFVLLGASMWFASRDQNRENMIAAAIGIALPTLALTEYMTGAPVGLGEVLFDHYVTEETASPGLMAPNTAVGFILGHAAMLLPAVTARAMTANLCMGAGLAGALGYMISSVSTHDVGEGFTSMALHTSICFVLVGAPLAFSATRKR